MLAVRMQALCLHRKEGSAIPIPIGKFLLVEQDLFRAETANTDISQILHCVKCVGVVPTLQFLSIGALNNSSQRQQIHHFILMKQDYFLGGITTVQGRH